MQHLDPQKLIEASPLFRNLQPYESERILACLRPVSVERGSAILERGVWHGQLYIIASGRVSVLLGEERGLIPGKESLAVAQLGAGECFGEMSLLTGEPPSATVRAEQDTSLWALPQVDFLALLSDCPTLTQNINAVLSLRLARTNQHILLRHSAERVLLAIVDSPGASPSRTLAPHIASALAERSRKRILLVEMCGMDMAAGQHFAVHAGQARPSLLECARDHSLLHAHRAPTTAADGRHFAALSALASTPQSLDDAEENLPALLSQLANLAALYDYVLLAITERTPGALLRGVAEQCSSAALLISAGMEEEGRRIASAIEQVQGAAPSIFVAHMAGRPTVGEQDRAAARLGLDVTRLLPADDALLAACWEQRQPLSEVRPEAELARGVDFVARHIAHQTVGIAFGGGGARGFAHLGVLEQLVAHHVPIDYIAACSSGIITPGMYLLGKSFAESEEIFLQIQRNIVRWRIPRTSIFSNAGLKRMLRELCGETRFEDLTTPFAMVAIDLSSRSGVTLDRGLLWQAGLASVALPGIFPPVLVGNHILMDAGMHDPVPIRLVRKMGAHILIASELGGQEPPALTSATPWLAELEQQNQKHSRFSPSQRSPTITDLLTRTYDLAMATIGMHSIREADVVIRPKLHRVSLRQFSEGRKFVKAGREAVEEMLPELRKRLPWVE
ncbi:MAG TPA: patatin-like phospholipase family protein [Ktedonobacteraceae bacterium]|nr:patatin-like phospholipase family protein [Ktedonobacteraceae bacterium]